MCMSSQSSNGVIELAFVRDLVGACVGRLPETGNEIIGPLLYYVFQVCVLFENVCSI